MKYEPRGGTLDMFLDRGREVALVGAAGTGKTVGALMKLHLTSMLVPGLQSLAVRRTHASLVASTLVTFERFVAAQELESGQVKWFGGSGSKPPGYYYQNGSVLMVCGMDNPGRVLSMSLDRVLADEADQLTLAMHEVLLTRLRGNAPTYKQSVLCCNPGAPTHWLKERADDPDTALTMHTSLHKDNPYLFDRSGFPTEMGTDYLATLEGLTGIRRARYLEGRWCAAEGLVFNDWSEIDLVIDRSVVPESCWDLHSIDWGYQNALVWQVWKVDHDNRMYLWHEVSRKNWLVEDFARHVREWCDEHGWPDAVVADHDAEDRATFERHARLPTIAARKAVAQGVQAVQNRLRKDATGRPQLFVVRDSLSGRDPVAEARKTPRGVLAEVTGYVWATERGADGIPKEAPLKQNDHSMDAMRYAVMYLDGAAPAKVGNPASAQQSGRVGVAGGILSRPVAR